MQREPKAGLSRPSAGAELTSQSSSDASLRLRRVPKHLDGNQMDTEGRDKLAPPSLSSSSFSLSLVTRVDTAANY